MNSLTVTLVFLVAVLLSVLLQYWLATRQMRHVAANRSQVPPAFAQVVTPQAHERAAAYTLDKGRFALLQAAVGAAVLLGWTLLGGLDALNAAFLSLGTGAGTVAGGANSAGGWALANPMLYQLALVAAFVLISSVIDLPFDWYRTFRLEERHGFNRTTLGVWLTDALKGAAVGAVIGLPLLALVLWLMGAAGGLWWLWAWGAWMAFNLLLLVIYPTWIAPLFNKFKPLEDESLKARVQALMQRCGFAAKGLFVMDGSRRSAHANAYFTGLGASKRVVFYDTLLARLNATEVEAVLAHELGHFKHRHVFKRIATVFAMSLVGLALLGWLSAQGAFYAGLGVQPNLGLPNDALALILFTLALPSFSFFISPLMALSSRRHEFEADAYACAQANGASLASALLKLHEDNAATLTPDPWYVRFYYSHPPASERLAALPRPAV